MINFTYDYKLFINKYLLIRFNIVKPSPIKFISFNISYKNIIDNKKNLGVVLMGLKMMTSFSPKPTFAKNSIATFKIRKNMALGSKVFLSSKDTFDFLYKFKTSILPTINDLKPLLKNNFDENNNYNIGLNDITIYPEITYSFEYFDKLMGMNINFVFYSEKDINIKGINKILGKWV